MFLAFTRQTKNAASIEVTNDDGVPYFQITVNRYKPKDIKFVAELWNVPQPEALAKINTVCECDDPEFIDSVEFTPRPGVIEALLADRPIEPAIPDPLDNPSGTQSPPRRNTFYVRNINQLKQFGLSFVDDSSEVAFRAALNGPLGNANFTEPLIEWTDQEAFCCLDIDYHDKALEERLTPETAGLIVSRIKPQPLAWHMSHGRGVKLYYLASPGFTASELAAIAGISWVGMEPCSTFDLIRSTRHPCYERARDGAPAPVASPEAISYIYGNSDVSTIRKMLAAEVEYSDVEEFLQSRGYYFGATLPHSECPISPTDDDKQNVFVGESGIFCHRCQARGYGFGTPGFMPYARLVGTVDNRIVTMVKHFCHFEHAKVVLQNVFPKVPVKILADTYRIMLKILHTPDDPRIHAAMFAGKGFIRTRGQWVTADGAESLSEQKSLFINNLPAVKFVDKNEGKLVPDVNKVVAFNNAGDISEYGYPDISFLRGCKIYGQFMSYKREENIKVIIRPEFKNCIPQYLIESKRMPTEEAWGFLDSTFPGVDRNYIKLLIAAKGASEGRLAQCPFLLIAGPTSAGKSTSVHIAAGLCGDKADEPTFHPQVDRFRQALMDGARNSGFLCINEVFKMADRNKLSYTQALDPMLSLTEDSRSHVLYVGSVPFGRLPVFVLTDIEIPAEVERDYQLARRFTFYRLGQSNNWQDQIISAGIRPHEFRLISYEHNLAADTILSEVIDEFFHEPIPLHEMATKLQSGTLDNYSGEKDRTLESLKRFYQLVCDAAPLTGSHAQRYSGRGWKMIDRASMGPLNDVWDDLCDGKEPEQWSKSRVVASQDWKKILELSFPIICELRVTKSSQNVVYVRFASVENRRRPEWINGQGVTK